jgi:DNA-binding transcriptional regulator YiaG
MNSIATNRQKSGMVFYLRNPCLTAARAYGFHPATMKTPKQFDFAAPIELDQVPPIDSKAKFRAARVALDISQQGLADMFGTTLRAVQYWEDENASSQPHRAACLVLEWMIAGFRPPQYVRRSNTGRKNSEQPT